MVMVITPWPASYCLQLTNLAHEEAPPTKKTDSTRRPLGIPGRTALLHASQLESIQRETRPKTVACKEITILLQGLYTLFRGYQKMFKHFVASSKVGLHTSSQNGRNSKLPVLNGFNRIIPNLCRKHSFKTELLGSQVDHTTKSVAWSGLCHLHHAANTH